jgi:transcriptional regulator with XRE-family HTH domain
MNLRQWLDAECVEIKQLAGKLGVTRHTVHNWLTGGVMPLRVHKALIQKVTSGKVTIGEWLNGPKKIDKRLRGSKTNGMHSTQRMGDDKKIVAKGRKAAR